MAGKGAMLATCCGGHVSRVGVLIRREKNVGQGNSKCKAPEAGRSLVCMENCQGVHVATGSEARRGAWEET